MAVASVPTLTWYCRPMALSVSPRRTTWIRPAADPAAAKPATTANAEHLRNIGNKSNSGRPVQRNRLQAV